MKIKILDIILPIYFILVFLIIKTFNIYSIIFLIAAILIDKYTKLDKGTKNLIYLTSAFSVFNLLFMIFLLILPFTVFGALLKKKNFSRDYILGYAISFIPVNVIYLMTTYTSISFNYFFMILTFYSLPLIALFFLKKKALGTFKVGIKESIAILIILFFTLVVAVNIIDNENLFMSNGVRIFSRVHYTVEGLSKTGAYPLYNPGIAQGEPTSLWDTPSFKSHVAMLSYIIRSSSSILFFNTLSVFILFLSGLGLFVLFFSIANWDKSLSCSLAVTATTLLISLNFYFLQKLESFKANYTFPIAYLLLSIIIDNPKRYKEFIVMMFLSVILITTHIPYGSGAIFIAGSIFLVRKIYYVKDQTEIKRLFNLALIKKFIIFLTLIIVVLMPLFYISTGFIFIDFLDKQTVESKISLDSIKKDSSVFFQGLIFGTIPDFLSLRFPDANRIDDHVVGPIVAILGTLSFLILIMAFKFKESKRFRIFTFGWVLSLILSSMFYSKINVYVGGFFRTNQPYLLILLGVSIIGLISTIKNKQTRYFLTAIIFIGFLASLPIAKDNITSIHKEHFASGNIYQKELKFISQLPIDGRILTYGLFNNAIDFGGNYLTGRYFSRDERAEFNLKRKIFEKIHGQHSFGDQNIISSNTNIQLTNYLKLGGFKYLFMNIQYPIANYVLSQIYPNYTYPIYQNGPLVILTVNNTNYVEKVDLVKGVSEEKYKDKDGYKYISISPHYDFKVKEEDFTKDPMEPEALEFDRISPTEIRIYGDFKERDFVVFKEQYFSRWKAYMDDKEIPVYSTLHEMVLIRTNPGKEIVLKYEVLDIEKVVGLLSLVAHLVFSALLIIYLRI